MQHVRLRYDARNHDHWVIVDDVYEAVHDRAALEGDGMFESAPGNWMVIHIHYAACGVTWAPPTPEPTE